MIKKSGLCLFSFMLAGCLYTDMTIPLTTNFNNTKVGTKRFVLDERRLSEPVTGLGISVAWTEDLIRSEAKKAGITQIHFIEQEIVSVLLDIYIHRKLIIYGD